MASHASTAEHSQSISKLLAFWIFSVLGLWTFAHALNRWLLIMDERPPALRFTWWTAAKLVTWLLPTWLLLRRCGVAQLRWLRWCFAAPCCERERKWR